MGRLKEHCTEHCILINVLKYNINTHSKSENSFIIIKFISNIDCDLLLNVNVNELKSVN